jgi:hypothetical protein
VSSELSARAAAARVEPELGFFGDGDGAAARQGERRCRHLDALEPEAPAVLGHDDRAPERSGRTGERARLRPIRLEPAIDDEVKVPLGVSAGSSGTIQENVPVMRDGSSFGHELAPRDRPSAAHD